MTRHEDFCSETNCDICAPDWRAKSLVDQAVQHAKDRTYVESTIQSQQVWFQNAKPQLCCTICDATPETWTPPTRTMTSTTTPSTTNTTTTTTDKDSSTIPYKWWTRSIKNPKPNQAKNICLCPTCGMGPWHSYGPMQWRIETPVYQPIRTCHSTLWAKVGKDRIRQACHQLYNDINYPTNKKPACFKAVEKELHRRGLLASATATSSSSSKSPVTTDSNSSNRPLDTTTATPTNETANVKNDNRNTTYGVDVEKENPTQVSLSSNMLRRVTWDGSQDVLHENSRRHNRNDSQTLPPSKKYKLGQGDSLVGEGTLPSPLISS